MNYINRDMKHVKIPWYRKVLELLNKRIEP